MKTVIQVGFGVAHIVARLIQHAVLAGLGTGVYNALLVGHGGTNIADRFLWGFANCMAFAGLLTTALLIRGLGKAVESAQDYARPARSLTTALAAGLGVSLAIQLFSSNPAIVGVAAIFGAVLGLAAGWSPRKPALYAPTVAVTE